MRLRRFDHGVYGVSIGNVGLVRQTVPGRLPHQVVRGLPTVQVVDHDTRTLLNKRVHQVAAQTTSAARYQNNLVGKYNGGAGRFSVHGIP
jgi:hypothetical protein